MSHDPRQADMHVETDVLIIGSGGAGMYAAIEAARAGASVFLADRSLIGRGGATVMAQMTVAVALGAETPDHWSHHYDDTLEAGRGLCDERLARLLCEDGPACIRQMDEWGIGWARKDGHIAQVFAPGHDRPRCVYVDFLNTGPAVSKTLRGVVTRAKGIRKAGDLLIVPPESCHWLRWRSAAGLALVFKAPQRAGVGRFPAGKVICRFCPHYKCGCVLPNGFMPQE